MRLNYYQFPEGTPNETMVEHGCKGIYKTRFGGDLYTAEQLLDMGVEWEEMKRLFSEARILTGVEDTTLYGISVTRAKELLRSFRGIAWTDHCERDGSVFEVTPIVLKGNNSKFKYNHHL